MKAKGKSGNPTAPRFQTNESYEVLLRMRRAKPLRFRRSISLGSQRCVEIYAKQKAQATQTAKKSKRAQKVKATASASARTLRQRRLKS